jgi:putative ABC transport system permease protein
MTTLFDDMRFGIRLMARSPGLTSIAIMALSLGIGANTAIFSVVNHVLLGALPFKEGDRLVMVWGTRGSAKDDISPILPSDFADIQSQNHVFEGMAASSDAVYTLTGAGDPESIIGYRFDSDFFSVVGATPILGRTFTAEEAKQGASNVVVLSYSLWNRRFGGDPEIIGKSITLSGTPYTVIGVMPPGFNHPAGVVQLWTPLKLSASTLTDRNATIIRAVARLAPGIPMTQAQIEMNGLARQLEERYPDSNTGLGFKLVSLREMYVGDVRPALLILLAAVGLVLLIACANIANLLLAKASARQKEVAIRTALGAGRLRLIKQFLIESLVLSTTGGAIGFVLALLARRPLLALFPNDIANLNIPPVHEIPIDSKVLCFVAGASVLTGLLFGIAPALKNSRLNVSEALKEAGRASSSPRDLSLRNALVISEISLALVLLIGASLLIQSFLRLNRSPFGFEPSHALSLEVFLPQYKYRDGKSRLAFLRETLAKMKEISGVQKAGATNFLPLSGFWGTTPFVLEGQPRPRPGQEPKADSRVATPDYFDSMGIRLVRGRVFDEGDREGTHQVAVINETLARQQLPDRDPIGARLNLGDDARPDYWEIVGVVGDVKSFGLEKETHLDIYRPFYQVPYPLIAFTLRTGSNPDSYAGAVRDAIRSVDSDQAVFKVVTMEQMAAESLSLRRVSMILMGCFASLALLLAALGIYGVISYAVTLRTHEIGIRMALGASRRQVLRMLLQQGVILALAGLAVGLSAAFVAARFVSSIVYEISPSDPVTYLSISSILLTVAVLASLVPARRATRLDPMAALRYE